MEINITPQGFQKVSAGMTSAELDKPVDVVTEEPVAEPAVAPTADPVVETSEPTPEQVEVDEPKVPKSRFLTMHSRAVEAERLLAQERAERASQPVPVQRTEPTELPDYWVEMFGDSDASQKAFEAEQSRLADIEEKAAERAFERLSSREKEEQDRVASIVESFDKGFEELGIVQDHEFTDDEQVAILDIVEQYSPKDKDGKLLREFLLPLDKAYEIYSVRSEAKTTATRQARDSVAALTGARSEGSSEGAAPGSWQPGQWRTKIP